MLCSLPVSSVLYSFFSDHSILHCSALWSVLSEAGGGIGELRNWDISQIFQIFSHIFLRMGARPWAYFQLCRVNILPLLNNYYSNMCSAPVLSWLAQFGSFGRHGYAKLWSAPYTLQNTNSAYLAKSFDNSGQNALCLRTRSMADGTATLCRKVNL